MSNSPTANITNRFRRSRKTASQDLIAVIRLLAVPAVLAEIRSRQVVSTNAAFNEMSGFQQIELENLDLHQLLTGWEDEFFTSNPTGFYTHTVLSLQQKSGESLPIKLDVRVLPPENQFAILTFESQGATHQRPEHFWQDLQQQATAYNKPGFKEAATQILEAALHLNGVDQGSLYLASGSAPKLERFTSVGNTQWMPATISTSDFSGLQTFVDWRYGKRQPTEIHRQAQHAHITFLETIPLGTPGALIGLLVLAGSTGTPDEMMPIKMAFTTEILTGLLQKYQIEKELTNLQHNYARMKITFDGLMKNNIRGVLILSAKGIVEDFNPAAEKMLGYNRKETIGQPADRILIGSDSLLGCLPPNTDFPKLFDGDIRLFRRSGESFLAHAQIISVSDETRPYSFILLLHDLSEQEQLQEQRRLLEQRAILGEITAVFAHEVRNPINNLSTGLELLSMNLADDDPNKPAVDRLMQDVDRLADLVKSVLSYTKPIEYTMLTVHLKSFFQSLLERMKPRIEKQNITAQLDVEANCPPIRGNPRALEQVFSNLITNAIQAMSDTGGQVYIKIRRSSSPTLVTLDNREYVEINIIDTGPGIPTEIQEHLFQPFFTTKEGGTGIGLAISKRIISAHKGAIRLNSFPGGTVFQVLLPTMEREVNL